MSNRSVGQKYERRVETLKRKRDHLEQRIQDFKGNPSYDKAELTAIQWAIDIIEANPELALELLTKEGK